MPAKPKKTTIKDIAEMAGVSRATVSRVLSNPSVVSQPRQEAVHRAIKDLSYRPSPIARGLTTGRVPCLHVLISDIRNPFYAEMARGVEDAARNNDYAVVFGNTDDSPERELQYLAHTNELRFAGVIMMSAVGKVDLKKALCELNRPVVLANRLVPGMEADAVVLNNEHGAYHATRYLIDLGHRRICHLAGLRYSSASAERKRGFVRAVEEAALDIPQGSVFSGDLRVESGETMGRRLVKEGLKCTAIFAANDLMAIGLISAFESEGIRVPEDVSVIGFDDIAYAGLPRVQLTTIKQPSYEMGRAALNMLLERVRGESSAFRMMRFEPELVERGTCSVPRS